jgi:hypothetical protein
MLASFRMAAKIAVLPVIANTQTIQNSGQKKPDLAKAFNRAAALRSNKCKGRFDARTGLKGLRQVTRPSSDYLAIKGSGHLTSLALAWFKPFS